MTTFSELNVGDVVQPTPINTIGSGSQECRLIITKKEDDLIRITCEIHASCYNTLGYYSRQEVVTDLLLSPLDTLLSLA